MQVLQLLTGFLLINWLSKDVYADYTLVVAITGTTSLLVSLGFSQCLTGLIGANVKDSTLVGRYLAACLYYRNRLLVLGSLGLLPILLYIANGVGWSLSGALVFWGLISVGLYFQAQQSVFRPVLLLEERLSKLYAISLASSLIRFVLLLAAYLCGLLSAPIAIACGVIQELIIGVGNWQATKRAISWPSAVADFRNERSEVWGQTVPRMPSLVFTAFSGQLMVFFIGIFGTKDGIAEIGALSRLAMLFVVLKKASGVLVAPYFAKLNASQVPGRVGLTYAGLVALIVGVSLPVFLYPDPLLWILGDGYQHLGYEAFLVVLAALIRVSSMLIFSVCNARKIVFAWYSIVDVLPQVAVIALWLLCFDLSVLENVLYFAIAIACVKLLSKSFILFCGLRQAKRSADS